MLLQNSHFNSSSIIVSRECLFYSDLAKAIGHEKLDSGFNYSIKMEMFI